MLIQKLIALVLCLVPAVAQASRYEFQSNFWVNLHQRLLYTAQFKDAVDLSLSGESSERWKRAIESYRKRFERRAPHFDDELMRISDALSRTTGDALPDSIPVEVRETLLNVAHIYRQAQWPSDDRANRFFIAAAKGLLAETEDELIAAHERVYGRKYPSQIRVDIAAYAGEFGAYTVGQPTRAHVTMSSRDPSYQAYSTLEMLMHEPSHVVVGPRNGAIGPEIAAAAKKLGRDVPRNLWHAVLFHTSGELTRRLLADRGVAGYVPYIEGMYERGFRGFREPLTTFWIGYIDGKFSREEAIERLVEAVTAGK